MVKERVVIAARDGDTAWVRRASPAACARCAQAGGCTAGAWLRWLAPRPRVLAVPGAGARAVVGDSAVLALDERWLLRALAVVYGAPLAGLLAGAALGHWLGGDAAAVALGVLGLAAAAAAGRAVQAQAAPAVQLCDTQPQAGTANKVC